MNPQPSIATPTAEFQVATLAVIGVGLIGGSLALALKQQNRVGKVIGSGRGLASLQRALELGVIDEIAPSPAQAIAQAEVVVVATPVAAMEPLFQVLRDRLRPPQILTDVGSVKGGICAVAKAHLGAHFNRFVPGHPVAGKEHAGVDAASASLFQNHNVVLTPTSQTAEAAFTTVRQMWEAVGAKVRTMSPAAHDELLALTSHLPHILAYAMVDLFSRSAAEDAEQMAAGGFYDFTRTASSSAEMWRDICLLNRDEILAQIDQFSARLQSLRENIAHADGAELARLFSAARKTRALVAEKRSSVSNHDG